jgi:CheY-like chemotaxis protein
LQNDSAISPTVLLVEDDESILDLMSRALQEAGFTVVTAAHGAIALKALEEHAVDVVVTDILMPEMDGFELMRRLRSEKPHLPIVAMSGINDVSNFHRLAYRFGAKIALSKPVSRVNLVDLVRRVLASSSQASAPHNT